MSVPYLYKDKRTGVYYFRKVLNKEQQTVIGKKEIYKSLGTKSPREAKELCIDYAAEVNKELRKLAPKPFDPIKAWAKVNFPGQQVGDTLPIRYVTTNEEEPFHSFNDVYNMLKQEKQFKPATVSAYDAIIKEFPHSSNDIRKISKETIRQYKNELLAKSYSSITVNGRINTLSGVFNYALNHEFIENNPCDGLKMKIVKTDDSRIAYTEDDLNAILAKIKDFKGTTQEYRYWIIILSMYTGARAEEICGLLKPDIKKDCDTWYIDIHRNVKNYSSIRKVPIHPDIIALGFIDYVNSRESLLWDLNTKKARVSNSMVQWYSKNISVDMIKDDRKTFHSFRHTFKQKCREADIHSDVHDRLSGHAAPNAGAKYGDYPLSVLSEAIGKLRFPQF